MITVWGSYGSDNDSEEIKDTDDKPTTTKAQEPSNFSYDKTEDLSAIDTEYTLTAGNYTAGIDIPIGKCDLKAVMGTGNVFSSNMYEGGINALFGVDDETQSYTDSFTGLSLPKDTVLTVSGNVEIKLIYSTLDGGFIGRTYNEKKAVTLSDGNYYVGSDFKEGTYKITVISGSGNIYNSSMYDNALNEMFGVEDESELYIPQFNNAVFKTADTISVSGGLTVKFTPTA